MIVIVLTHRVLVKFEGDIHINTQHLINTVINNIVVVNVKRLLASRIQITWFSSRFPLRKGIFFPLKVILVSKEFCSPYLFLL